MTKAGGLRLAVVGASGTLGTEVVRAAVAAGHGVTAVMHTSQRSFGPAVDIRRGDALTGQGLLEAFAGADVVVDAYNNPDPSTLVAGTRMLLSAATAVGVRHYMSVSIVGCDRVPVKYFEGKVGQEETIAASAVPWSVLRATQFHDLIAKMLATRVLGLHFVPGKMLIQPVAAHEVANELVRAAPGGPQGRMPDFAGPEVLRADAAFELWRASRGGRGIAVPIPMIGPSLRALKDGVLTNPERAMGRETFAEWLRPKTSPVTIPVHAT
jgi:uncharacterized protein YbjT (DUF2867 family)